MDIGQDMSVRPIFIQQKLDDKFVKIADIDDSHLCNMTDAFWVDDYTFYYRLDDYGQADFPNTCYKLEIKLYEKK